MQTSGSPLEGLNGRKGLNVWLLIRLLHRLDASSRRRANARQSTITQRPNNSSFKPQAAFCFASKTTVSPHSSFSRYWQALEEMGVGLPAMLSTGKVCVCVCVRVRVQVPSGWSPPFSWSPADIEFGPPTTAFSPEALRARDANESEEKAAAWRREATDPFY